MFTLLSPKTNVRYGDEFSLFRPDKKTDEYMSFKVGDNVVLVRLWSQNSGLPRAKRLSAEIIKIQEARDRWNELCRSGWTI